MVWVFIDAGVEIKYRTIWKLNQFLRTNRHDSISRHAVLLCRVADGLWSTASGKRPLASGLWLAASGRPLLEHEQQDSQSASNKMGLENSSGFHVAAPLF